MKKIIILCVVLMFVGMSFTSISGNKINNQTIKPTDRVVEVDLETTVGFRMQ
jgi:hypothetical protein